MSHSRAPTLTHSPPSSAADLRALSREHAAAAFYRRDAPEEWLKDKARLAILSPPGLLVSASPAMLALFGARDCEALEARLGHGDGPAARRLRRLAATLPLGEPPRLEQMRLVVERRPVSVNLHCVRIAGPGDVSWLLVSAPALGVAIDEPPALAEAREAPLPKTISALDLGEQPAPHATSAPAPNSRFLWTLDEEGRFGAPHPVLGAAVGLNAPHLGEPLETLLGRVGMAEGDELARVVGERETFSRVILKWPLPGLDRRRLIALSAAPMFGRHREFLGYRGFGVLGEEIAAAAVSESNLSAELADAHRSALPEAFQHEPSRPTSEGEAEARAGKSVGEPVEPHLELAAGDAPESPPPESSPPEASLETDGAHSAPSLTEAGAPDALPAETAEPDLAERSAASELQPAPPERTAAIYVLRHPSAAASSNIVPIRPGALDSLARETAQSFPAESVELSRSERDAFREIARALVGRTPASRDEPSDERAGADARRELRNETGAEQQADRQGEAAGSRGADGDEVRRNAGAVLDRLPVGARVAPDGRALYANRTLLELIGYRDFAGFQTANALSRMFRDRDPRAMTTEDIGAIAIVRADGQILSVDGHAQVITWDGAPATLIALRRSLEAELRARMRVAENEAATPGGLASRDLQAMLDRASDGAVTLDLAGRILSLNEPAEHLFGYHRNEIAGESLLMLLAPQSHPEATARLESLSHGEAEGVFRPLQVVGRDRAGVSIPLALTLARIGPRETPQFCALVRDLSRERDAERRLIAAREVA